MLAIIGASILLLACAAPDTPRLERGTARDSGELFDSPREIVVVDATPDIGRLVLRGQVVGREPHVVVAPADGFVSGVAYLPGDRVDRNAVVLRFSPEPSVAQQLEREIALLEVELAAERGDGDALADARNALDQIDERLAAEGRNLAAPVSGLLQGTRTGVGYNVVEGDELFSIVDAQDVVISVATPEETVVGVTAGASVLVSAGSSAAPFSSTVEARTPTESGVELQVEVSDPEASSIDVGDLVSVEVPLEDTSPNSQLVWVPEEAIHRESGRTFMLVEQDGGSLRRVDSTIVRRTETHAQVQTRSSGLLAVGSRLVLP